MTKTIEDFTAFITPYLEESPPSQGLDTRIDDLEIDSLSFLELVQAIDEEYDITIDLDQVTSDSTLRQLYERFVR